MSLKNKIYDPLRFFFFRRFFLKKMRPNGLILPTHLAIETTNCCNASCSFCPSIRQTRKRGTMSQMLFEKIISDAKSLNSVEFITHGGMGEPLIDKAIAERIAFEKKQLNASVQLHTNGSLLTETAANQLFDAGLDVLSISLNAFYASTHNTVTGLDYQTIKQNVERVFDMKKNLNTPTDIRITLVKSDALSNQEIRKFQNHWKQFTPYVTVHLMKNWGNFTKNTVQGTPAPCKWLWNMMSIKWDGRVSICHEDYNGEIIIGDLNNEEIKTLFNCDLIKRYRKNFFERNFNCSAMCKNCSMPYLDKSFWLYAHVVTFPDGGIKYTYHKR